MLYKTDYKMSFSFEFLVFSLVSLVRNLGDNDFKHLIQEFNSDVLDLVKQKGFYSYEHMCDFEKFNETLTSKKQKQVL